jgi:plasmid stabilization system protein ParE
MRIIFSPAARRDLDTAIEYVARESPRAARGLLDRLDRVLQLLADGSLKGPAVRIRSGRQAHRWSVPPFRLYYRRSRDELFVIRVYHQARRPIEQ